MKGTNMIRVNRLLNKLSHDGLHTADVQYRHSSHYFHIAGLLKKKKQKTLLAVLCLLTVTFLSTAFITYYRLLPGLPPNKRPRLDAVQADIIRMVLHNDYHNLERLLTTYQYADVTDEYGWTPLHWAAFLNNHSIAQLLSDHGASWDTPSTRAWYKYPAGTSPGDILMTNNTDLIQNLIAMSGI
jgi:hypothetical protein